MKRWKYGDSLLNSHLRSAVAAGEIGELSKLSPYFLDVHMETPHG
jgi:hypothetical protein